MRKYAIDDERLIRTERAAREWLRSGLISPAAFDRIAPDLQVPVRRTNLFLRLVLFGFGVLIITASVALVAVIGKPGGDSSVAMLFLFGSAGAFALGEFLINEFRLYRFGIEEAAATMSAALLTLAVIFFTTSLHAGYRPEFVAAVAGAFATLLVYLRYGYLYAAIVSMACVIIAPFQLQLDEPLQRLLPAAILAGVFLVARRRYQELDAEYPADECAVIEASAWTGMYLVLNLQIRSLVWRLYFPLQPSESMVAFYWLTYAVVWVLPAIGLYLGIRDRNRPLIDISVGLALLTLITNKSYLGGVRQTWDPILLGLILIVTGLLVKRYLTIPRKGFTATRLLSSDKQRLSVLGTASAALQVNPSGTSQPSREFEGGGGRSGGAGASGSF